MTPTGAASLAQPGVPSVLWTLMRVTTPLMKQDGSRRYAGVSYDPDSLDIVLGETPLMRSGQPLEFDAKAASQYLAEVTRQHGTVHIRLSLGDGPGTGVAWGCDLSYDYVKINAEYTT